MIFNFVLIIFLGGKDHIYTHNQAHPLLNTLDLRFQRESEIDGIYQEKRK